MSILVRYSIIVVTLFAVSSSVNASVIGYCNDVGDIEAVDHNVLNVGQIKLTDAVVASSGDVVLAGSNISATNCLGVFELGNSENDWKFLLGDENTGIAEDGLLNGEYSETYVDFLDGGAFITPDYLQDLDGVDQYGDNNYVDDPGWVYLGKEDLEENDKELVELDGVKLEDYISIDFGCNYGCKTGTWELSFIDPNGLLAALESTVFGDSFFDHLAFSFKMGREFVIYDFDFNILNMGTGLFDLTAPHNMKGTFDLSGFQHGVSHISMLARDPVDVQVDIPEPSSYSLVLLGLLSLSLRMKKPS